MQELENFQFSIMYEFSEEREAEEQKMRETNHEVAKILIDKGLAAAHEEWISKYVKT
jgi:hypothetical protein